VHNVHNVNSFKNNDELQASADNPRSRTDAHDTVDNEGTVHDWSRTEKETCTVYHGNINNKVGAAHDVHEKLGGMAETKSSLFSTDEVDPLGGDL